MHLIYLDESGNSGLNLNDPDQPVFCLCAMIVAEKNWQSLEVSLQRVLDRRIPSWKGIDRFEVHGCDLRTGTGHFKGMSVADRVQLRDEWMAVGKQLGVRLMYRSVRKKRYADWLLKEFGSAVKINPHVVAFALLARCIDNHLKALVGSPLGMLISDENKEVTADVEKSIKVFRGLDGVLKLSQIVEKGFFIDSSKSLPLQLCDLFALSIRKSEERKWGMRAKSVDDSGIEFARELTVDDRQHDNDALSWLISERKKEAARG